MLKSKTMPYGIRVNVKVPSGNTVPRYSRGATSLVMAWRGVVS